MKQITKLALTVALAIGMTFGAQALEITPETLPQWTGPETSQAQINAAIAPIIGDATLLYKQNVGGSEVGSLAGSYETTFSNSATDPSDALIHYGGGNYVGDTSWLLVKDGNNNPGWYLFNLTKLDWDGMEDLVLSDFWVGRGAISHVSLYGTAVPDGGTTMALLGLGIGAIGFLRRKLA